MKLADEKCVPCLGGTPVGPDNLCRPILLQVFNDQAPSYPWPGSSLFGPHLHFSAQAVIQLDIAGLAKSSRRIG